MQSVWLWSDPNDVRNRMGLAEHLSRSCLSASPQKRIRNSKLHIDLTSAGLTHGAR